MGAPASVIELVARFHRNRETYRSAAYNETQVRREFIDPLFLALGWDIDNRAGYAEAYKDVIHEDAIKIGGATKAPDYCFRIGGRRVFFLEAKKPAVNVREEVSPAYQLRRYAWSAKLPLSILTDFEELAVYDCRIKPAPGDKASTGRTQFFKYTEYDDRWDELAAVFSRDAVLKGSFDKYAETTRLKRGTAEVDAAFLHEIESWRETLARNFALRNTDLDTRELNFAVQRTIDRLIFLRMCEDRGIELYQQLQTIANGDSCYRRLCELFRLADERYNSGLFHFEPEKGRAEAPDELTTRLALDDKPLKDIIRGLYYPESPYEFSVLPAEILGQVYEQFLGKVIRLTAGHRAVVEDKPEVKKAGGVYYTPAYIVDHIVRQTVGKLVDGRTPRQVSKLHVLDPACGSGSFLVGAYHFLLDWHRDQYVAAGPAKHVKEIYQGPGGQWHLTTSEKKRILLNNIYGVDIDAQAVEVTKLSLLLKVLEGENRQSLERQLRFVHERALPDLGSNIKCGNSLIGPDFYNERQTSLLDEEEQYRINAFDWRGEFPEIFKGKDGGFDAVIGNPPYIPIELMASWERQYFQSEFPQLQRKYDSSVIFILAMLRRLSKSGRLAYISSITWQTGENYAALREHLFRHVGVTELINLPFDVFKNAYVDTGVYVLSAERSKEYLIHRCPKKQRLVNLRSVPLVRVPTELIAPPDYKIVLDPNAHQILLRLEADPSFATLGSLTISTQGLAGNRFKTSARAPSEYWYPYVKTGQVYRFLLSLEEVVACDMREHTSLRRFYEAVPKILIRRVINRQDRLMGAYTDKRLVFKKDVNPFLIVDDRCRPYFLLGILNSSLISYLYVNTSSIATKDDFRQTTLAELRRLPIPISGGRAVQRVEEASKEISKLLESHASARSSESRTRIQRRIAALDRQIDQLVYELYGLSHEEIATVEGAAPGVDQLAEPDSDEGRSIPYGDVRTHPPVLETRLPYWPVRRGKVRDVYDLGDRLLLVSTDRISAFDWVLPSGIPDKGRVLTQLSGFWFSLLDEPNHTLSMDMTALAELNVAEREALQGRSMLVRKTSVVPIECVVRGYLAGSGWKEYRQHGTVCGLKLPAGLRESDRLPEPIFTPATKEETGHDINIPFAQMIQIVGQDVAHELRRRSLAVYQRGAEHARQRGIIIADTKFEWGRVGGELILIDEVLTPDSSRFWPADLYQPGGSPPSFDKQFVRDWLESTPWDKNSPPPQLPADVIQRTRAKYVEAYERLTGRTFA